MTREDWLNELTDLLRPLFEDAGVPIPGKVRSTCGWPSRSARPGKKQRIGECWPADTSDDGHCEVFISPILSDPVEVGETLVHELVHTAMESGVGHKAPFRKAALAIGLEGKMTATNAGEELVDRLRVLTKGIGDYPHAKISVHPDDKKQGTRMLKLLCPECGYLARTTKKWIEMGTPTCVCGKKMDAV